MKSNDVVESGKEDVQILLNEILPFAKQMLSEHGEFYPYGGQMIETGAIVHIGGQIKGVDHPPSSNILDLLKERFRQDTTRNQCRATAIVFDVRITPPGETEKSDAIQVNLDHKNGYSAEVFFPYLISTDGTVFFGKSFAQKGRGDVFSIKSDNP